METKFYFYSQMHIGNQIFEFDSIRKTFPNVRDANVRSKKFDNAKDCIDACNAFVHTRVEEMNKNGKDLIIVWDANPIYAALVPGINSGNASQRKWEDEEVLKYFVIKKSEVITRPLNPDEQRPALESSFVTTIIISKEITSPILPANRLVN